jgi:C_GCAxxG_C_C family probable redox protein
MIADACYIGCNRIYDESFGWIKNGSAQPTLYITTEQEKEEIQTMMLAFLANVNEDHILNGKYEGDEEDRVLEAARILAESPLYIEELPDFSLQDIEDRIKKNIRDHDVKYVFHDYIHTSLKILEEITRRSGGVKLREDNILFMLSIRLKDICNQHGVFILSSTQLNGDYQDAKTPDQNLLRGAKAIADKIDYGSILLGVKEEDAFKMTEALGLGLAGLMETCGAVSAMMILAGLKNSDGNMAKPTTKKSSYALGKQLADTFKNKNTTIVCRELKNGPVRSCSGCIADAAKIVEETLFSGEFEPYEEEIL